MVLVSFAGEGNFHIFIQVACRTERINQFGPHIDRNVECRGKEIDTIRQGSRFAILGGKSYAAWILAVWDPFMTEVADLEIVPYRLRIAESEKAERVEIRPHDLSPCMEPFRQILKAETETAVPTTGLRNLPAKIAASRISPDLLDRLLDESDLEKVLDEDLRLMEQSASGFDALLSGKQNPTAAEIGTATHAVLQFCDYRFLKEQGVSAELERLVAKRFLSQRTADAVRLRELEAFRNSDLIEEILSAVWARRELQFSFLLPLSRITRNPELKKRLGDETVFVQGSIDLLYETRDGKLILCDYKTDHVTERERTDLDQLISRFRQAHGEQLSVYAQAVRRMFGKNPDRTLIYSTSLGKTLQIF